MPRVVPIRESFENVRALLASMAEEPGLVGFAGAMILDDGTHVPVCHGLDRRDIALVGTIMHQLSLTENDDDDGSA